MNFDKLNKWLTLGANIGVVLGLIILIVEVRQNAAISRAALEIDKNNLMVDIELRLATSTASSAWIKSIRAPETLTDEERIVIDAYLAAILLQWDNLFQMEYADLTTRKRVEEHISNVAPFFFGSRHAQNWWRLQGPGWEGTPMLEAAGPIIEAVDPDFLATYLDDMLLPAPDEVAAP